MTNKINTQPPVKKHQSAALGVVLSVLALLLVGIASLLIRDPVVKSGSTATEAAATKVVGSAVGSILAMPLTIGTFILALLAIIFAAVKFRNAKVGSLVTVGLSVWAISIAVHVFKHIAGK